MPALQKMDSIHGSMVRYHQSLSHLGLVLSRARIFSSLYDYDFRQNPHAHRAEFCRISFSTDSIDYPNDYNAKSNAASKNKTNQANDHSPHCLNQSNFTISFSQILKNDSVNLRHPETPALAKGYNS